MCGIVGTIGSGDAVPVLVEGLQRLVPGATTRRASPCWDHQGLKVHKRAGRVDDLDATCPRGCRAIVGIGHTRWATHGERTEANCHPHGRGGSHRDRAQRHRRQRRCAARQLVAAGVTMFRSDTDTEVLAELIGLQPARRS